MTADAPNPKTNTNAGTLMPTLALVFAAIAIVFALSSMVLGSRMATLSHNQMNAYNEAAASEKNAIGEMETALQEAHQLVEAEQAGAEKLRKQLSAAMQEVKTLKTEIAKVNQSINALKSEAAAAPVLESVDPKPATPQDSLPATPAISIGTENNSVQVPSNTEAAVPRAADAPESIQEKSSSPHTGQVKSQPIEETPEPDNQKVRLEESYIQSGPSATEPSTAPEMAAPKTEVSEEKTVN